MTDIRELWDFSDPAASRAKFEAARDGATPEFCDELTTQIARTHSLSGEFAEAHRVLDQLERGLNARAAIVQVRYALERGRTYNSAKAPDDARPHFLRAWELAQSAQLDGLAVDAAHMMAIVESRDEAVAWNERALAYAEASSEPDAKRWLGSLCNNLGWTFHDDGQFEKALGLFEKALAWRLEQGAKKPIHIAHWTVGRALRSLGRLHEALDVQEELRRKSESEGGSHGFVLEELAELHLLLDDKQTATHYFAAAHEQLCEIDWIAPERLERLERLGQA